MKASEDRCDLALSENAKLLASMLEARVENGLPAKTGSLAVERAMEAIEHGAQARAKMLAAHAELSRLNLRELAIGDLDDCPDDWKIQQDGPALRVVLAPGS